MREAVICEPVRTPVGRYGGMFRDVTAASLAATAIRGLLTRTGLPDDVVDDVVLGQCYPNGEAPAIGRVAALDAGTPDRGRRDSARPALRLRPAGHHLRRHVRADRRQ